MQMHTRGESPKVEAVQVRDLDTLISVTSLFHLRISLISCSLVSNLLVIDKVGRDSSTKGSISSLVDPDNNSREGSKDSSSKTLKWPIF